jgi:hypothetical protein
MNLHGKLGVLASRKDAERGAFWTIALVFRNSLDDRVRSTGQVIEKAIDLSRHNRTPFFY